MNTPQPNPTRQQFESRFSKGIYTKSLILSVLIRCNASADLIYKAITIYYNHTIALRTVYKYLGELVLCGRVTKHVSLIDTRTKIYSITR